MDVDNDQDSDIDVQNVGNNNNNNNVADDEQNNDLDGIGNEHEAKFGNEMDRLEDDEDDDMDDDEEDVEYSFEIELDSTNILVTLLKGLQPSGLKKTDLHPLLVSINEAGLKLMVEKHKSMQASVLIERSFFTKFTFSNAFTFCIDLRSLIECLTIFGESCLLYFKRDADQDDVCVILIDTNCEHPVATECHLKRFEFDNPVKFADLEKGTRLKSSYLKDAFSEIDVLGKDDMSMWIHCVESSDDANSRMQRNLISSVRVNEDDIDHNIGNVNSNNNNNNDINMDINDVDGDSNMDGENGLVYNRNDIARIDKEMNDISERHLQSSGSTDGFDGVRRQRKFMLGIDSEFRFECDVPVTNDVFVLQESFKTCFFNYKMNLIRTALRGIVKADNTRIHIDNDGMLTMRHIIETGGDKRQTIRYDIMPMANTGAF